MALFAIQGDIPSILYQLDWTSKQVRSLWKFSKVWKLLESVGWKWTKGRDLVSFYYIRPNCQALPPFAVGIEYFQSEEEVMHYVVHTIQKHRSQEEPTGYFNYEDTKRTSRTNGSDSDGEGGQGDDEGDGQYFARNAASDSEGDEGDADSTNVDEVATEKLDIMKAPWGAVWRVLRSKGWTWNFGSKISSSWYIAPGYTVKTAITGIHKFDDDMAVRKHIKYNHNMPEFAITSSKEGVQIRAQDSQISIDVTTPRNNWQLVTNRRKRPRNSGLVNEKSIDSDSLEAKRGMKSSKSKNQITGEQSSARNHSSNFSGRKNVTVIPSERKRSKLLPEESVNNRHDIDSQDGDEEQTCFEAEEPTQAQVYYFFLTYLSIRVKSIRSMQNFSPFRKAGIVRKISASNAMNRSEELVAPKSNQSTSLSSPAVSNLFKATAIHASHKKPVSQQHTLKIFSGLRFVLCGFSEHLKYFNCHL